jgi:hypothetical protein
MNEETSHEARAEEEVALRWFCSIGALVACVVTVEFVCGLLFGPRAFSQPSDMYVLVGMCALYFVLYTNVSGAHSPCSWLPIAARVMGTLLTVCTCIVIPLHGHFVSVILESEPLAFCVASSLPFLSWSSGVSGLGLWPSGEKWSHALLFGILRGIGILLILGLVLYVVAASTINRYDGYVCPGPGICYG